MINLRWRAGIRGAVAAVALLLLVGDTGFRRGVVAPVSPLAAPRPAGTGAVADPVDRVNPADPAAELLAADRAFAADSRIRGAAAWAAVWAERGLKEGGNGGQVVGPDSVAASLAPTLERLGPRFRWDPDSAALLWPDSLGYTVGRWWIDGEGGGPSAVNGRYLTVWLREAGAWRVALDMALHAGPCTGRGADDFDFWLGDWNVSQRILSTGGQYLTFPAHTTVSRAGPCALAESWDGTVRYVWAGMQEPEHIRGASVRAWDPATLQWRIYWIDTTAPAFGVPFRGGFTNGEGTFLAPPLHVGGAERRIRFTRRGEAVLWELDIRPPGSAWTTLWSMTDVRR